MKNKIVYILVTLLFALSLTLPVFGDDKQRLVDDANLLTAEEATELSAKLDEISERLQFDVVIHTTDAITDGKTPEAYADDYFDYNGYGYGPEYDGIILIVAMESRDWHMSTCGYGITAFTDAGIDYIGEEVVFWLSDGFYYDAFDTFAYYCDEFVTSAKNGTIYDGSNMPKGEFSPGFALFIGIVLGLIIGGIAVFIMYKSLKTVSPKGSAAGYTKQGSMALNVERDIYLYRTVKRTKIETNSGGGSSTHVSSSGRSHGGGGGKF